MSTQLAHLSAPGHHAERLRELLSREGLGAIVLTSPENVYYLSGYPTLPTSGNPILYSLRNVLPYSLVVGVDGTRALLCWGFSVHDVNVDVERVVTFNERNEAFGALAGELRSCLGDAPVGSTSVGIEASTPHEVSEYLRRQAPGIEFKVIDDGLRALRRVKSEAEVALLLQSAEIAESALERVFSELKVGSSRLDMIRLAKQTVLEQGGDGVGHVTMSFGHANPEIALDETLGEGDLVVVDVGAKLNGYTSDCRRYGYVGAVPQVLAERHQQMCEVVATVGAALKPGASFSSLMRLCRDGFARMGLPLQSRFTHVGHGIGLETEEEWIDDSSSIIEEGMVVAIELYADASGYGSIGDEETYVIRNRGPEQLTQLDTAIREIR